MTVLKGIDLHVAPGEKVALVGASGSGKSTIVKLLLRFYPVSRGQVTIDGRDIESFDLEAYRDQLALVPQEVLLFGGTIRENITYGRLAATDEQVRAAARQANALDFIEAFPEGFDTLVGDRGIQLSGGQRQRVAIARAILKDPRSYCSTRPPVASTPRASGWYRKLSTTSCAAVPASSSLTAWLRSATSTAFT